ncbi:hypothetical protein JCM6882_004979, partial [Rhodosporidiobolus microsporus]
MRRCNLYILLTLMLSYLLKVISYVATMNSTGNRAHENVKTVDDWAPNSTIYSISLVIAQVPATILGVGNLSLALEAGLYPGIMAYGFKYVPESLYPWQYVFILEGLLGVLVSAGLYFLLPNSCFLMPDEREFVQARLPPNAARATDADFSWKEMRMAVTDPLTWLFTFLELSYNSGTYGLLYWLPTIIAGWGFKGTAQKQLHASTSIPRPYFLLQNSVIIMGLYSGLAYCRSLGGLYAIILILQGFAGWSINIYWPWRAQTLKGASYAATAIAFQNSLAGLSGFYTPHLFQAKYKPYYQVPFFICFAFFGTCALVCLATWYATYDVERGTRRVAAAQRKGGKLNNENIADNIE